MGRRHHQRPIEGKRYSPPRSGSMASPVAALKSNYGLDSSALAICLRDSGRSSGTCAMPLRTTMIPRRASKVRGGVGRQHHQRPSKGKRYSPPRIMSMASPVAALKWKYGSDGPALASCCKTALDGSGACAKVPMRRTTQAGKAQPRQSAAGVKGARRGGTQTPPAANRGQTDFAAALLTMTSL